MKTKSKLRTARTKKAVRELIPGEADRQRTESAPDEDDPFVFDGPRETIAATVPVKLAKVVRAMVGSRGFSKVVAEALAREVVRLNREAFVRTMEAEDGPADPELVARYRRLFSR